MQLLILSWDSIDDAITKVENCYGFLRVHLSTVKFSLDVEIMFSKNAKLPNTTHNNGTEMPINRDGLCGTAQWSASMLVTRLHSSGLRIDYCFTKKITINIGCIAYSCQHLQCKCLIGRTIATV